MRHRCEDNTDIGDERHAAEQGIGRRKYFAPERFYLCYRSHTAQDHRSVVYRIDPGNVCDIMIPEHAYQQAYRQQAAGNVKIIRQPFVKYPQRRQFLGFILVMFKQG